MSEEVPPQWSDEVVAESFRSEILARFEAHNATSLARDAAELEVVLRERPDLRGQPGFVVRDSLEWEAYKASEIRIDRNSVTIVLPQYIAIGIDFMHLLDHTTVAWGRPSINATIVDGEARPTIEILLVATWNDALDAAWKEADPRHGQRRVLAELYAEDVETLCTFIDKHANVAGGDPMSHMRVIRDWLRQALDIC